MATITKDAAKVILSEHAAARIELRALVSEGCLRTLETFQDIDEATEMLQKQKAEANLWLTHNGRRLKILPGDQVPPGTLGFFEPIIK